MDKASTGFSLKTCPIVYFASIFIKFSANVFGFGNSWIFALGCLFLWALLAKTSYLYDDEVIWLDAEVLVLLIAYITLSVNPRWYEADLTPLLVHVFIIDTFVFGCFLILKDF